MSNDAELAEANNTITALRGHLASSRERVDQLMAEAANTDAAEAKMADVLRRVRECDRAFGGEHSSGGELLREKLPEAFTDTDDSKQGG